MIRKNDRGAIGIKNEEIIIIVALMRFLFGVILDEVGSHTINTVRALTDKAPPSGDDSDRFSTVARSSSTLAEIGADPLLSGLISTRILRSCSSFSESLSESEEKISEKN